MTILYSIGLGVICAVIVGFLVRRMMFTVTGAARSTVVSLIMGVSIWPITLRAYKLLGISESDQYPSLDMSFPAIMVFLLLFAWFIVIQMFVLIAIELVMPSGTLSALIRSAPKIPTWYPPSQQARPDTEDPHQVRALSVPATSDPDSAGLLA